MKREVKHGRGAPSMTADYYNVEEAGADAARDLRVGELGRDLSAQILQGDGAGR
jgi:hypothetical protein